MKQKALHIPLSLSAQQLYYGYTGDVASKSVSQSAPTLCLTSDTAEKSIPPLTGHSSHTGQRGVPEAKYQRRHCATVRIRQGLQSMKKTSEDVKEDKTSTEVHSRILTADYSISVFLSANPPTQYSHIQYAVRNAASNTCHRKDCSVLYVCSRNTACTSHYVPLRICQEDRPLAARI